MGGEASHPELLEENAFNSVELSILKGLFDRGPDYLKSNVFGSQLNELKEYGTHLSKGDAEATACDNFDAFQLLSTQLLRSAPSVILQTCFNAVKLINKTAEDANLHFLLLLLEFSNPITSPGNCTSSLTGREMIIAKKLLIFMNSHLSTGVDLIKSNCLRNYLPHASRLLVDHYYTTFGLSSLTSENYEAFLKPYYTDATGKLLSTTMISSQDLVPLALYSHGIQGELRTLYNTDTDGFDFLNLQQALMGFEGGTLIIIKAAKDEHVHSAISTSSSTTTTTKSAPKIFGAYTSTSWKDTKATYGSCMGFTFTLDPSFSIMEGMSYHYLNTKSYDKVDMA